MNNYREEATQNIEIDEDGIGLFCSIQSEMNKDRFYTVRCEEHAHEVVVTSCTCKGFYYYKRCKHVSMVQAFWTNIYKPVEIKVVEAPKEAPVKKQRKPRNGLVRKVRNGGLIRVEQKQTAKIIDFPVQPAKITDVSTMGNFGTKAFSILR